MEDAVTSGQQQWMKFANETYIKEAGWYFKTLAVQEIGKGTVFEVVMVNSRITDWIKPSFKTRDCRCFPNW